MKSFIKNFFKDNIFFSVFYFISNILIILFYFIMTKGEIEILYPASISVFVYAIFLVIKFYHYYNFNIRLEKSVSNNDYQLPVYSCEQENIKRIISQIHHNYTQEIQKIQINNIDKNRFISQWIHNMKVPVSVIDLILQKDKLEDIDLKSIDEENEKLLSFLEQVLVLIRLDDFSKDYNPETVDLITTVKKVINSRKNQFIYNNVFPKFDQLEPVFVLTDSKWNDIMLEQIISNAIKYSALSDNAKYVYFTLKQTSGQTILCIRDEGIGIPECDLGRIYEPFFTGENGRKCKNSTGIGLYLCLEISEKLGQKIKIESEEGKGTTVNISYLSKL